MKSWLLQGPKELLLPIFFNHFWEIRCSFGWLSFESWDAPPQQQWHCRILPFLALRGFPFPLHPPPKKKTNLHEHVTGFPQKKQTFIYATLLQYCCWWFRNPKANHCGMDVSPDPGKWWGFQLQLNLNWWVSLPHVWLPSKTQGQTFRDRRCEGPGGPDDVEPHGMSWVTLIVGFLGDILLKGFKGGFGKRGKSEIWSVITYQTCLERHEFPRLASLLDPFKSFWFRGNLKSGWR